MAPARGLAATLVLLACARPQAFRPARLTMLAEPVPARKLQGLGPKSGGDPRINANSRLLNWLQDGGVWVSDLSDWGQAPHPLAISVETFDQDNMELSGRGLLARREINEGEELVVIPLRMCMTKVTAAEAFPAAASAVEKLDDYLALALILMKERAAGDASPWRPYFEVLPSLQEVNPTFAWGDTELGALEGSPLLKATQSMQAKLQAEWALLERTIFAKHPQLFPEDAFNFDYFTWAFAMLFSRAVRIRSLESGETLALVPYADLINHSPFSNAFIDGRSPQGLDRVFSLKEEEVVLYSDRSYKRMEQVVISYGQKSNAELLLLYGFALDRNPYNSVDIGLALLDESTAASEEGLDEVDMKLLSAKRKFLDTRGRQDEAAFPLYGDRYPEELLEYLRLLVLNGNDFANIVARRRRISESSTAAKLARAAASLVDDTTKAAPAVVEEEAGVAAANKAGVGAMGVQDMNLALGNIDFREYISRENEEAALSALKRTAEAALARYPTRESEDVSMMADNTMFRMLPREVRMAVRHRRGEKRILARTLAVVEKDLARMRG